MKPEEKNLVYMAGKISKNDWRHNLIGKIDNDNIGRHDYWGIWNNNKKGEYISFDDKLIYTGPFFISCDHGCSHGESTHGAGESACIENKYPSKKELFNGCLEQIGKSDYVFCWLDDLTAYGTLFELGIAHEKKKKIFLAINKKLEPQDSGKCLCGNDFSNSNDAVGKGCCHSGVVLNPDELWFIKQSCTFTDYYENPMEAWNSFLDFLYPNLKKEKEKFITTLSPNEREDFEELKNKQPLSKTIIYFKRNRKIVQQLKKIYNNQCQICEFTFKKDNGENYSETHHLIPLGENGFDNIKNLIVVCPNCHKKLHYAKNKKYDIKYREEHYNLVKGVHNDLS